MAETTLESLAVLIEANTKQYANAMTKLERDTQRAINNSTKAVKSLDSNLGKIGGTATKVASLLGVSLGVRAFAGWIKSSIEAADATGDLADKIGITAEALQELSFAAKVSGTDQDALVTAFRGMTKIMGEAAAGSKTAKAEFIALGLSFEQLKGQSPDKVFEILLDTIGRIQDPLQRNAELMAVFGKSGADMAQLAMRGADGIEQLRQRARDLGIVLSGDDLQKLGDTNDRLDELSMVLAAAGEKLAVDFLPAINALAAAIQSEGFQSALKTTANVIANIVQVLSDHPVLAKMLAGGAAGFAVGGPTGAVIGAGAVGLGESFGAVDRAISGPSTPRQVLDLGSISAPGQSLAQGGMAGRARAPVVPKHVDPEVQSQIDATRKKYEELTKSLQDQFAALSMTDREQAIANAQAQLGLHATEAQKNAIGELEGKLYDAAKAMDEANQRAQFFGEAITDSLSALILQGQGAQDVLKNLITKLAEAALQAALLGQGPLASLFGTAPARSGGIGGLIGSLFGAGGGGGVSFFGGGFGMRANGGPVGAGSPYIVGEKGPELFVPKMPGTIIPNGGFGGASIIYSPTIDARGADSAAVARLADVIAADKRNFHQNVIAAVKRGQSGRELR